MTSESNTGRVAGLLYLVVVATGIFSLAYVPSHIAVNEGVSVAIRNILASESMFRAGLVSFLIEQVAFLLLPLVLFRLFSASNRSAAWLMVVFALASVPISLVALAQRASVLDLLAPADHGIGAAQIEPLVAMALKQYGSGILIASLFWGLWLLPLGYLIVRSQLVPWLLGVVLMLGGVGYVVDVFGQLTSPYYAASPLAAYVLLPAAIGEIGLCLYLVAFGVRRSGMLPASGRWPGSS